MNEIALFQMPEPFRQSLIRGHLFYVEQARERLLSQFNDIDSEADGVGQLALERNSAFYNPEADNGDSLQEDAYDQMCEFHRLLSEMREQTFLSLTAGMFHEWDKQLRDWLVSEIQRWHRGGEVAKKVWSVDFGGIADLLESFNWRIRSKDYFNKLDACRLVVNVYKHGEGKSFEDLQERFPEYLDSPLAGPVGRRRSFPNYTHLKVDGDQFLAFSDAIVEFWKAVPEDVFVSDVNSLPKWFEKAFDIDGAGGNRAQTR